MVLNCSLAMASPTNLTAVDLPLQSVPAWLNSEILHQVSRFSKYFDGFLLAVSVVEAWEVRICLDRHLRKSP